MCDEAIEKRSIEEAIAMEPSTARRHGGRFTGQRGAGLLHAKALQARALQSKALHTAAWVLASLWLGSGALAEPASQGSVGGEQLQLGRGVARSLFAIQRQEREASTGTSLSKLLDELEALRRDVKSKPWLPARTGFVGPGAAGSESASELASESRSKALERQRRARSERRTRVQAGARRLRSAARGLEAEIDSLPTPRLRAVARQAAVKARGLATEAEAILDLPERESRAQAHRLHLRLERGPRLPTAQSPAAGSDSPTLTSITRHRRAGATQR